MIITKAEQVYQQTGHRAFRIDHSSSNYCKMFPRRQPCKRAFYNLPRVHDSITCTQDREDPNEVEHHMVYIIRGLPLIDLMSGWLQFCVTAKSVLLINTHAKFLALHHPRQARTDRAAPNFGTYSSISRHCTVMRKAVSRKTNEIEPRRRIVHWLFRIACMESKWKV